MTTSKWFESEVSLWMPKCLFGKELSLISVSLGGFCTESQNRIIALTLWLEKVFPASLWFYHKVIFNFLLQLINTCLYQRVMCLRVLLPKPTFLLKCLCIEIFDNFSIVQYERLLKPEKKAFYPLFISVSVPEIWAFKVSEISRKNLNRKLSILYWNVKSFVAMATFSIWAFIN